MRRLHVAAAQIHALAGDTEGNLRRLERQVASAAAVGVEVILFAEAVVHAYDLSAEGLTLAEPADGPAGECLARLAHAHGITILAGLLERSGDRVYVSHIVVRPDGRRGVQRKHVLTDAERAVGVSPGPRERAVFTFGGVRSAILICADVATDGIFDEFREKGVEFCFMPAAGGGTRQEMLSEAALDTEEGPAAYVADRARVFRTEAVLATSSGSCRGPNRAASGGPPAAYASANALGHDGRGVWHRGHCMIVDRHRVMRAQIAGTNIIEHQQDQMIHASLSFADP